MSPAREHKPLDTPLTADDVRQEIAAVKGFEQDEVAALAAEADALKTCIVALGGLPRLRRVAVLDYIRERCASYNSIDMIGALMNEKIPRLKEAEDLAVANATRVQELTRELAQAKADAKAAVRAAKTPEELAAEVDERLAAARPHPGGLTP